MAALRRIVSAESTGAQHQAAIEFLREHSRGGEVLVLAPSRAAADELARAAAGEGLAGVHRYTPPQLAAILAAPALGERGIAPMSRLVMEALAARVTHQLRKAGRLAYFSPVADTPGFARALASTLSEIRLEQIDGAQLAESGLPGADLAALLALYAKQLEQSALADFAVIVDIAAQSAAVSGAHRLLGLPLLLLDVAVRTKLEQRFAEAIAGTAPAVLACAPSGDVETQNALEQSLGVAAEALAQREASTLDRVRRYLFSGDVAAAAAEDSTLDMFSAAGEGLECVEIARRLHTLAADGLPFDGAAVLLRSPERYLPLLEEALRRAGIPAYFSRGTARPDPAGRAFLALLACAADGCSASRFAEFLSLAQVPALDAQGVPMHVPRQWTRTDDEVLSAFQGEDSGAAAPKEDAPTLSAPIGWEQLLIDASVIGGRDRWERRLDGLERELALQLKAIPNEEETRRAAIERRVEQLRRLRAFALPLIERLDALPKEALWGQWLDALTEIAETALRGPESVLSVLNELRPMAEVGPAALEEVYGVLSERLSFLRVEPPLRPYGRLWVGSIEEARGRAFDVVFLPGLAEGIFPKRAAEDPLLLDVFRKRFDGLTLQQDRVARERLLLRIAAASARTRLVVSYPRMDSGLSRPRVPSFYALEVLRAATGSLPNLEEFGRRAAAAAPSRLGFPAPEDPREAIDDAEYDIAMLERLRKLPEGEAAGRARYVFVNAALGRALRTRYKRWQPAWSAVDGLVDHDPNVLKILREQRPSERAYSPTALQHFAACPYRFFLQAVLHLQPRETKAAIEKLDPLTRGALFHEVQFAFLSALRNEGRLPLRPDGLGYALDLADRVLDRTERSYAEELAPAIPGVWRTEIEDIRTDLRGWVRQLAEAPPDWVPLHFEYAFGLQGERTRDPASRAEEAVILDGVRLRGSIDLIEKHATRDILRITDHKTGKPPDPFPLHIGGGRHLQPVLYSLAVEKLLGMPVEWARLSYCTQRGNYFEGLVAIKDIARHAIQLAAQTIGNHLEDGFLPAAPAPDACEWCPFHAVCGPYEEIRITRKARKELEPLTLLRSLP